MILDYAEKTGKFLVKVPRDHDLINKLMKVDGLNFWTGSPKDEAILWTDNVYAALTYSEHSTPSAKKLLTTYLPELTASYQKDGSGSYSVPDGYNLYPYQKAGVDYCLRRNSALIGDEPGLGKTAQAIVIANEMKAKSILVVTPANIRLQWQERIHQWCTMKHRFLTYPILKSSDGVHPTAEWVIISYDLMRSPEIQAAIAQRTWDLIILDEAHKLKNPETKQTQALFGDDAVCQNAGYVLALTGTPLPNRPSECFTLAKNLCWDAIDYMSQDEFTSRFNPQMLKEYGRGKKAKIEKKGRLAELRNRLRVNFMVRRKKRDVLDQLPDIRYDVIHVQENGQVRRALEYEAENLRDIDPTDLSGSNAEILGHISTARKLMGVAIAPLAADYVTEILEGGEHKVFVPAWHIDVLNILEQRLAKFNPVRVDGSTSARRKEAAVLKFQDDDQCRVFIGNIQSIGVGVDGLQNVCSRGICAEPSWTPADNDQAVGRLERIGQKHGILFEFVTAKGSLIELILQRSLEKLQDIHSSLDG
jgi:SNF2 family DNA or RNA helicase